MATNLNVNPNSDLGALAKVAPTSNSSAINLNGTSSPTVNGTPISSLIDPRKVYLAQEAGVTDGLNEYEKDFATKSFEENYAKYGEEARIADGKIAAVAARDSQGAYQERSVPRALADTGISFGNAAAQGILGFADMVNKYATPWAALDQVTGSHISNAVTGALNTAKNGLNSLAEMGYSDEITRDNLIKGYKNAQDEAVHEREYNEALANGESPFNASMARLAKDFGSGVSNALSTPTAATEAPAQLLGSLVAMMVGNKGLGVVANVAKSALGVGAKAVTAGAERAAVAGETALTRAGAQATANTAERAGVAGAERASVAGTEAVPTAEQAMGLGAQTAESVAPTTAAEVAAGASRVATPTATTTAESVAQNTATNAATRAASATAVASEGTGKGALTKIKDFLEEPFQVGMQEGGGAGLDAYDEVMNMSDEDLTKKSEMYREAKKKYLAQGLSEKEAQAKAKDDVAASASYKASAYTAAMAAPWGKLMPKGIIKNPVKVLANPTSWAENTLKEAASEGFEGTGGIGSNLAKKETYDNDTDILEGVGTGMGEGFASAGMGTAEMGAPKMIGKALKGTLGKVLGKASEKVFGEDGSNEGSISSAKRFKVDVNNLKKSKGVINEALNAARASTLKGEAEVGNNTDEASQNPNGTTSTENTATNTDPVTQSAIDTLEHMNNVDSATFESDDEAEEFNYYFGSNDKPVVSKGSSKLEALHLATNAVTRTLKALSKKGIENNPDAALAVFGMVDYYQRAYNSLFGARDLTAALSTATDDEQRSAIRKAFNDYNSLANTTQYNQIVKQANDLAKKIVQQQTDLANNTSMSQEDKTKAYRRTLNAYAQLLSNTLMSNDQLNKAKETVEAAQKNGGIDEKITTSFLEVINSQIEENNEFNAIEEKRLKQLAQIARTEQGDDFFDSPEEAKKFATGKGINEVQYQKLHNKLGISDGKRSLHSTRAKVQDLMRKGQVGEALNEMQAYRAFVQSQINKLNAYKESHVNWIRQHAKDGGKGTKTKAEAVGYDSYNPQTKEWYRNEDGIYAGNPMLGAALAIEEEALVAEYNELQKKFFPQYGPNAKDSPLAPLTGYGDNSKISNARLVKHHEGWKAFQKAANNLASENDSLYASEESAKEKTETKEKATEEAKDKKETKTEAKSGEKSLDDIKEPKNVTESDYILALLEDQEIRIDPDKAETNGYLFQGKANAPKAWQVPARHDFVAQKDGITDVKGMEHLKPLEDSQQTTPRTRSYAVVGTLNSDTKKDLPKDIFSKLDKSEHLTLRTGKTGTKDQNLEGFAEDKVKNKKARLRGIRAGHVKGNVYPTYYINRASEISNDLFNKDGKLTGTEQSQNTATTMQILGIDLASPVDFLVCYSPKDKNGNYTEGKEAIELAQKLNIPVFNFAENPEQTGKDFDAFLEKYNAEKKLQDEVKTAVNASVDKAINTLQEQSYKKDAVEKFKKAKPLFMDALWKLDPQNIASPEKTIHDIVDDVNGSLADPITDGPVLQAIRDTLTKALHQLQASVEDARNKKQEYEKANTATSAQLDPILKEVDQELGLSQQNVDIEAVKNKLQNFKLDTATDIDSVRSLLTDVVPSTILNEVAESLRKKLFAQSPLEKERIFKEQKAAQEKLEAEQEAKDANLRFAKAKKKLFGLSGGKYESLAHFKDTLTKLADPAYQRSPGELSAKDAQALLAALDSDPKSPNSLFNRVKASLAKFCNNETGFYKNDGDYRNSAGEVVTGKAPYFTPNKESVFYKTFKNRGYISKQKTDEAGNELFTETETGDTVPVEQNVKEWQEHRQIRISYNDALSVLNDPEKAKDVSREEYAALCQVFPTLMLMKYDENKKLVVDDDIVGNMIVNAIAMFNNQKDGSGYTWERLAENFGMTVGQIQGIRAGKTKNGVTSISGSKFLELSSSSIMLKPLITGLKRNMRKSLGIHYDDNMLEAAAQRTESILATSMLNALTDPATNYVTKYTCNIGNTVTLFAINDKETSIFSTITDPDALNRMLGNEKSAEEGEVTTIGGKITRSENATILNSNIKISDAARAARDNYEQKTEFRVDQGMYSLYQALHKDNSKGIIELYGDKITERMDPADKLSKESANNLWIAGWNKIQRWVKGMQEVADIETNGDLSKVRKHFRFNFTAVNRIQEVESYGPTANKQTREVILSTWNTINVDKTLCEDPNTAEHKVWQELAAAVLQNLGAKLNADTVESATEAFTALVRSARDNANQEKYTHLLKLVKDPSNVTAEDVLKAQEEVNNFISKNAIFSESLNFKKVDQNFMSLHALQTLAQVINCQKTGQNTFESSLYVECDGTTNGSIFGKFLFTNKIDNTENGDLGIEVIQNGDMGNLRLGDPFGGTAGSVKHGIHKDENGNTKPKDLYEKSAQLAQTKMKQNIAKLKEKQVDSTTQRGIYNKYYEKNEVYTVKREANTWNDSDKKPQVVTDVFKKVTPENKKDIEQDPTTMTVTKMVNHVENLFKLSGLTDDITTALPEKVSRSFMKSPDTKGGYFAGAESIINSFLYGDRNGNGIFKALSENRSKVLNAELEKAKKNGGKQIPLTFHETAMAIFGDNPELKAQEEANRKAGKYTYKNIYDKALEDYLASLNALTQNRLIIEKDDNGNITSVKCVPVYVSAGADSWNTNKRDNGKRVPAMFTAASFGTYANETKSETVKDIDYSGFIAQTVGKDNELQASISLSEDNKRNIYLGVKAVYGDAIVEAVNETLKGEGISGTQQAMLDFSARSTAINSAVQASKVNRVNENTLTVGQFKKEFRNNNSKDNPYNNLVEYNSFSNTIGNVEDMSKYELSGGSIDNYQDFGRATKSISSSYLNWGSDTQELSQVTYECVVPSGARFIPTSTIGCGDADMMQTSMSEATQESYQNQDAYKTDNPLKVFDGENHSVGHVADGGYVINKTMFETAILQNPTEAVLDKVLTMDAAIDASLEADKTAEKGLESDIHNAAEDFSDMMNFLCFREKEVTETDTNGNTTTKNIKTPYIGCWDTQMRNFIGLYSPLELAKAKELGNFSEQEIANARAKAVKEYVQAKKQELAKDGEDLNYVSATWTEGDFILQNIDVAAIRSKAQEQVFRRFMKVHGKEIEDYVAKWENADNAKKNSKKTTTVAEAVAQETPKKDAEGKTLSKEQISANAKKARAMREQINNHIIPDYYLEKYADFFGVKVSYSEKETKDKDGKKTKAKKANMGPIHTAYKNAEIEEYRSAIAVFCGSYSVDNISDPTKPIITYTPLPIESRYWGIKDKITVHEDGKKTVEKGTLSLFKDTTEELSNTFEKISTDIAYNHASEWCMGATCDHMASGPNPYVLDPLDETTGGGVKGFKRMLEKLHLVPKGKATPTNQDYADLFNSYQLSEARALLDGIQSLHSNSDEFINSNELITVRFNGIEIPMTMEQARAEVLRQMNAWLRNNVDYDIRQISQNALAKAEKAVEDNKRLKKELQRHVETTTVADYLADNKDTNAIDQILSDFSDAFDTHHSAPNKNTKIVIVSGYETQQKDSSPLVARIESRRVLEEIYKEDMEKAHKDPSQAVIDHINGDKLVSADKEEAKRVNGRNFAPVQFYEPATDTIYLLNPNPSGPLDKEQSKLRHNVILPHEIMHSLSDRVITHFEDNDYEKWTHRDGNKTWFKSLSPMRKKAYAALERLHKLKSEIDNLSPETLEVLGKENPALQYYVANGKYLGSGQSMTEFVATFGTMSDEQLTALSKSIKEAGKGTTLQSLARNSEKELSTLVKLIQAVKNAYEAFLRIFTGKTDKSDIQKIIHSNLAILNIARNVEIDTNASVQSALGSPNTNAPSFLDTIQDNGRDPSETVDMETGTVEHNSRPVDTLSQLDKLANNLVSVIQDRTIKLREAVLARNTSNISVEEKAAASTEYLQKLSKAESEAYQIATTNNVLTRVVNPLQNLGFNTGNITSFAKVVSAFSLLQGLKSPVFGEVSLTVRKILDTLSPETFCSDPTDSVQLSKGLIITNFLQGIGKDSLNSSEITPVFLALSQTDPRFREILSGLKFPTKNTEGYLPVDKVLSNCLDSVSNALASLKGEKPNKSFVDAFDNAILQMLKTEGSLARVTLADKAVDKVENAIANTVNNLAKKAVNKVGKRFGFSTELTNSKLATGLENIVNTNKYVPHFVKEALHDVVGTNEQNYEFYEANTRVKTATQQTREVARQQIPKATKARFKTDVSEETWSRLTKTVGKSSLASLFNGETTEISKFLADPKAVKKEIIALSKTLNDKYQTAKCHQLAKYMMTGKAGKMLLRNPLAIAMKLGSGKIEKKPSQDTIKTIDRLVSLFALDQLSNEERTELSNLIKNDETAMKTLLGTAKNQQEEGIKKASGSNRGKLNWYKGAVASDYQNGAHFKIAHISRHEEMERFGYKLIRPYNGSNLDGTKLGVYYADFSPSNYLNPGAIQLTSSTANGINLATGTSTHPNGGTIIKREVVKAITASMGQYTSKNGEDLMPIFDENGEIVAYERSIDPRLLNDNKYVKPTTDYATLLGIQEGRNAEEKYIETFNDEVLDVLAKQYEKDKKDGRGHYYVDLFAVKDPVVANLVNRIPQKLRDKIANSFDGDGKFMVLPSEINDIIGYHSASITDSWTGESRLPPAVQQAFVYTCERILGKNAFKYLKKTENFAHDVVTSAKNMIIIRSVTVPAMNMFANMLQLYIEGVPVATIVSQTLHVTKELNQYTKLATQKIQIEQELSGELGGYREHQLRAQLRVLNSAIEHLDIAPLLKHKEFSSIANLGDVGRDFDFSNSTLGDKLIAKVDELSKNTLLRSATHYGFVAPDTSLYKFLEKSNQYGDFIGKAVLYHDLVKRRGYTDHQAHLKVKDEFVDYVRLPGRGRDYMERMGLLWFYNFKLRMQKVAFANLKEHPLRCLALSAMGLPTPLTDSLFGKFPVMSYTMGPTNMLMSAFTSNPWVMLLGLLF